jgi:hypothetical protein
VKPLISKPGFYPEITCEQYFAEPCPAPALTNSGIQLLNASCPAKFAHNHPAIGQPAEDRETTVARRMGDLVHRLALGKGKDYVVSPHDEFRTKEAKAWRDEQRAAGVAIVKQAELDKANEMAARIREAIEAETRGHLYQTEVVIAWKMTVSGFPIWCRAMLDVWCPSLNLALDVKKTRSASDKAIDSAMAGYGYAGQYSFYLDGICTLHESKERPRFGFLFVEDSAPFLPRYAECSEAFRSEAGSGIWRAATIFARCLQSGEWPGYRPHTSQPPAWWLAQMADFELEEAA